MSNDQKEPQTGKSIRQAVPWFAMGIAIGVALGVAMKNIALGLVIGIAIGTAIGFGQMQKNKG